ncbi:MAG: glutamine--fructose-6-phosphate transaminase (isomerizing) [Patescibacteria group bacterium]
MCGIFGYIGQKTNASEIVLEGLKTLEYRGYDSWGIAVRDSQGKLTIEKHIGKIGDKKLDGALASLQPQIAIGHTRWATHGGVTQKNAHPHYDCTRHIAVLHNGIVENFQELKNDLLKKGHRFTSETDTEVIAHLLEEEMKQVNASLKTSIQTVFAKLQGLNAIIAISTKSSEIVAAKNGSPLIIGIGQDEFFLASDLAGILPYTKDVLFLKDNELIALQKDIELVSLTTGKKLTPERETISWDIAQAVKGKYKHFMLKEIAEQPAIIETIAKTYTDQIEEIAGVITKAKGVFLIGSGTAFNACLAGTYLFSKIASRHVNTAPASEFMYLEDFLTKDSLIIPLSQSGETIDVIEPLIRAKQKKSKIMALVNVLGSTIYRMSDYKVLIGAGPEKAVASTKAYLAKISILTLIAYTLAGKLPEGKKLLLAASQEIERLLQEKSLAKIKKIAKILTKKDHLYIIGRGVSYATALEGALKIKEVSYIHTEGMAGGELKHGTIALIEKGTPCIVVAPEDETYDAIISNAIEIKSRGGYMIGISAKDHPTFDEWIEVKTTGAPLLTDIVPMQLLSYFMALSRKLDPDKPRNLAKSVTVK